MGMLLRFDGLEFRPGEQFVCRNQSFPHCLMLLGEVGNSLGDFFGMCQEKRHVERTSSIQYPDGCFQVGSLARIGSPLPTFPKIKGQFDCACGLSHAPLLLEST